MLQLMLCNQYNPGYYEHLLTASSGLIMASADLINGQYLQLLDHKARGWYGMTTKTLANNLHITKTA